jgi:hypothetical protein
MRVILQMLPGLKLKSTWKEEIVTLRKTTVDERRQV